MHCLFQVRLKSRSRRAHSHKLYPVSLLTVVGFGWQNVCPREAPALALHVQHAKLFACGSQVSLCHCSALCHGCCSAQCCILVGMSNTYVYKDDLAYTHI